MELNPCEKGFLAKPNESENKISRDAYLLCLKEWTTIFKMKEPQTVG